MILDEIISYYQIIKISKKDKFQKNNLKFLNRQKYPSFLNLSKNNMQLSAQNAFQVIFPKYVDLLTQSPLQVDQSLQQFIREQLPRKIQLVRSIQPTFLTFQTQFTNLILKRPKQQNLIQSLVVKASQKIDKYFYSLEISNDKQVNKNSLQNELQYINLQKIRTQFREKLKSMGDLLKQKYFQNIKLDRVVQEQIAKRLYSLNEIYYFIKNDLTSVATKFKLKEHQILSDINKNSKNQANTRQICDLIYLQSKFIQNIHQVVDKRCRPFLGKKDYFYSKVKQIQMQSQSKVPMNINMFIQSILNKQKYRITKQLTSTLSRQLKTINQQNQQSSQQQCKQIISQVDSLKKQFNQLKNNAFYLDIIRGSFGEKYKMELNKLENVYYLSNIQKYLQDVQTFTEKLIRVEEKIIGNRKCFMKNLGKDVEEKIVGVITEYQLKNQSNIQMLNDVIDAEFEALQNSLYGIISQEKQQRVTNNHLSSADQIKKKKLEQADQRRRQLQYEKQKKQSLRRKQLQQKAEQQRVKREQDKIKLQEKRRSQQDRMRKMREQRQQKQRVRRIQQEQKQKIRKIEMEQKMKQKKIKDERDRQRLKQQVKQKQQEKRKKQTQDAKVRQRLKVQRQQQQKRKKQQQQIAKRQQQQDRRRIEQSKSQQEQRLRRQKEQRQRTDRQQRQRKIQRQKDEKQRRQKQLKQKKQIEQQERKGQLENQKRERLQRQQNERKDRQRKQKDRQAQLEKERQAKLQKQKMQNEQRERIKLLQKQKKQADEKEKQLSAQLDKERRQQQQKQRKQRQQKQKKQRQQRQRKQKQQHQRQQRQNRQRKQKQQKQRKQRQRRQKQQKQQKQRMQKEEKQRIQKQKKQKQLKQQKQRQKRQNEARQAKQKQDIQRRQLQEQQRVKKQKQKKQKQKKQKQQRQRKELQLLLQQQDNQKKNKSKFSDKSKKGGSGINYNDFDDIIDDDLQEINQKQSKVSKKKGNRGNEDDEYGDNYEDDFESPEKQQQGQGQGQGQEQGEEQDVGTQIQPKQLITIQSIKCLNDYMKGTSYSRKNKPNLEPFNNKNYYTYIFEEFIEAKKIYIFDSSVSKAIFDFSKQLQDQNADDGDLKMSIQTIKEEMLNDYASKIGQEEFYPHSVLVLPFSFQNQFDIKLIEFLPQQGWFRPVVGKQFADQEAEEKFNSILEGLLHIFQINTEPIVQTLVINPQSSMVLSTFDNELPCLLTLFALHYQNQLKQDISITQYTVERFFYTAQVLKPFYEAIEQNEDEIIKFYSSAQQKYQSNEQIAIMPLQIQSSDPQYQTTLKQQSMQVKKAFLANQKQKSLLLMFQILLQAEPEEQQQTAVSVEKITIYCSIEKGNQGNPSITYFIVTKDEFQKQNASALFDIVSEGDQGFQVNVYMDYTRHNGLTQYSDWTLPLWARTVQKRKLTPLNAFRAITFAMSPYYIAFKEQD